MKEIIGILMERDGMTREEAVEVIEDVREEIMSAVRDGDYDTVEDILSSELGLEPDYIMDLL